MSKQHEIKTFSPSEDHPWFRDLPRKLYSTQMLKLQQASDKINKQFAAAGISVWTHGQLGGRLVLYAGTNLTREGKKILTIGNYECENDSATALLLLKTATEMAKMEGYQLVVGPMNGTTWDTYRFCTNPERGLFFSEMVHQPYYPKQWKEAGFHVLANYVSSIDRTLTHDGETVLHAEKRFEEKGIHFRTINLADYEAELKALFPLCEKAFAGNFLYAPVSVETFIEKYQAVKRYIVPEMVFIAENAAKKPVGFAFNFPDHLNSAEKRMILKTLVRDPDPAYRGLGEVLGNMSQRYAQQHDYKAIIHALIYSDNFSLELSKKYQGEVLKHYSLYFKEL